MDGTIHSYKNKKGEKLYRVIYRKDGKQTSKRGFKTKKEAHIFLNEIQNTILRGTYVAPEKITVAEFLNDWLQTYVEPKLKLTTYDGYRRNIKCHIIPSLGDIPLQKLRPDHIESFYIEKLNSGRVDGKGGLSLKSVTYIHRVFKNALKHAVRKQIIPKNVAAFVSPSSSKENAFEATVYDLAEISELLTVIRGTNLEVPVILGALLGMRRGEVLGLMWSEVDLKNKVIYIRNQLVKTYKGPAFSTPKTKESKRTIPISDNLVEILKKQRINQIENQLLFGEKYINKNLVVCQKDGEWINPDYLSRKFKRFLERHKLKHIRYHDLRHSYSTILIDHGEPMAVISKLLGHTSIKTTVDLYTHPLDKAKRKTNDAMDTALFGKDQPGDHDKSNGNPKSG